MAELLFIKSQMSGFKKLCNHLSVIGGYGFLVLVLLGCAKVIPIDKNQSDLMPKAVAMSIFEKYGYKEWAEKPFAYNMVGAWQCGNEKKYIEFNQLKQAHYASDSIVLPHTLVFIEQQNLLRSPYIIKFVNITESTALELTNAVRALGAIDIDRMLSD